MTVRTKEDMLKYGVDPYDKQYGIGYEQGHKGYSPYPRVNRISDADDITKNPIDVQRALLVTEAYKKYEASPIIIKRARALENVLRNVGIGVAEEDELFCGRLTERRRVAPIYPEFSIDWLDTDLDSFTENPDYTEAGTKRAHSMTPEVKEQIKSIVSYWKGRTVEDKIVARLSEDEKKGSNNGRAMYLLNLYQYAGIGHFCVNYGELCQIGFGGYKKRVMEKMAELDTTKAKDIEKREFYEALIIILDACTCYVNRYAEEAEAVAARVADPQRKKELERMADNCRQIAEGPALDTWQALQMWVFANVIIYQESNGHSVSAGRMDQWLFPFYKADIENETLSQEFIQELIEVAYLQWMGPQKVRDLQTIQANSTNGWGGESLTVGGVDRYGNDATNALTYMMLDASIHTRKAVPWMCVRVNDKMPEELKIKVAENIRAGFGHPKVFNDKVAIEACMKKGRTLEEARDYAVVGCVEIDTPGYENGWHDAAYFNANMVFELAINGGKCIGSDIQLGPDTGSLKDFTCIEEVEESFDKQMKYWCEKMVSGIEIMDIAHAEAASTPFVSIMTADCIERGKDVTQGGARYNHTCPQVAGIGNIADSFSVINQLVFDEKKVTGVELLDALEKDWEGYDTLYNLVNSSKVHHYGNDDDYADRYATLAYNTYCKYIEGRPNRRGGTYCPGVYTVTANVSLGALEAASIDGRHAHDALSDNMGPVHTTCCSHDILGPTAIAKSVTKMDHTRATNGTLLNWKFTPEAVSGEKGRDNLIQLLETYFRRGGMHSQVMITKRETLLDAQKHPEQYLDMLVRVAGYSANFVALTPALQKDLINRTELSFE